MAEQIIWAKQTVEGRQVTNDGSELRNFFFVPVDDVEEGKSPGILYSTPGITPHVTVGNLGARPDAIHGMIAVDSPAYGKRLYGISQGLNFFDLRAGAGAPSVRAFSNSPAEAYTGPARLASDGRRTVFIRGRSMVMWDQAENGGNGGFVPVYTPTSENPQELLPDENWVDVGWVNGYFLLLAYSGEIFHSRLHSGDFDQLDFATAERNPDPGVGLAVFGGRFYVFGSQTIEIYREVASATTGSGAVIPFAFGRIGDSAIPIGCVARDTIQVNEGGVFWLGSDESFYVTGGGLPTKLSNATVDYDVARSNAAQARGYVYTEEGRRFYSLILQFPDGTKKNWTIDLATRFWHERTITNILCAEEFDLKTVVGLDNSRTIFEQTLNEGRENGVIVERTAVASLIHNNRKVISFPAGFFDVPKFPLNGAPDDGRFALDWSDDGKQTWGETGVGAKPYRGSLPPGHADRVGTAQDNPVNLDAPNLRFNLLGATKGRNFRVRVNSPRRFQIEATYLESKELGGYGL